MAQVIETGNAGNGTADAKPERFYVVVTMPQALKELVDAWADENDTSAAELGRRLFAAELEFDLGSVPAIRRPRKHNTELEKITAHMIASHKSSLTRSLLVKQHKARLAGKTADVAAIDTQLVAMAAANWEPAADVMADIRAKAAKKVAEKAG